MLSAIFQTKYNTAASPTAANPILAHSLIHTAPLPPDHDHAEPLGTPLLRLKPFPDERPMYLQGRTPSTMLLICGSLIPSRVIRTPIRSESSTLR